MTMNESTTDDTLPQGSMEVTESVDGNGRRTRYVVSTHGDGFTCLHILTEEDLRQREQHEARTAVSRGD